MSVFSLFFNINLMNLLLETFAQVCRDPRWGRCYESYSEDHKVVQEMTEIIPGLQGDTPDNSPKGVPFVGGKYGLIKSTSYFLFVEK